MPPKRKTAIQLPDIVPGEWRGAFAGSASLRLGQVVQTTEPPQSVEFSQIIASVLLIMPEDCFTWPGVLIIGAPTPMKPVSEDAGMLIQNTQMTTLCLTLEATRGQSSDVVERSLLKRFKFALGDSKSCSGPVKSWGMSYELKL